MRPPPPRNDTTSFSTWPRRPIDVRIDVPDQLRPRNQATCGRYPQVIPEGAWRVKGVLDPGLGSLRVVAGMPVRASGSRLARSAIAQWPEGLDAGAWSATMFSAEMAVYGSRVFVGMVRACAHQCRWPGGWAGLVRRLLVIPSPGRDPAVRSCGDGLDGVRGAPVGGVNQSGSTAPGPRCCALLRVSGVMTCTTSRRPVQWVTRLSRALLRGR